MQHLSALRLHHFGLRSRCFSGAGLYGIHRELQSLDVNSAAFDISRVLRFTRLRNLELAVHTLHQVRELGSISSLRHLTYLSLIGRVGDPSLSVEPELWVSLPDLRHLKLFMIGTCIPVMPRLETLGLSHCRVSFASGPRDFVASRRVVTTIVDCGAPHLGWLAQE